MLIQFASDLHIEFPENREFLKANPIPSVGDVLVLAGDVVPFAVMDKHADFFNYISDHFKTTYWVPGNHEYYHFDIATRCGKLHEKIRSNVFLVNNITVENENIGFIFSTLWTQINPANKIYVERRLNDFKLINYEGTRFTAEHYNQLHEESFQFIKGELDNNKSRKAIVVTHHVPTFVNYPEKYKGDILNEAFAVEMYDTIEKDGPDFWIYGHHHSNSPAFKIGKTTMLTNQLGYLQYDENENFDIHKTFEIK